MDGADDHAAQVGTQPGAHTGAKVGPKAGTGSGERKRVGRRPGGGDTRGAVLDAARSEFAARGYEAASVRSVARAAGVDPALVHHYFGTKQGLFVAALNFPFDPAVLTQQVFGGDLASVGERAVRFALTQWEDPVVRERLVATLRAAAGSDQVAQLMSGFAVREFIGSVAARLEGPDPMLRVELAMSQIIGLAMARYVLGVPPLATAGVEELVALVGPTLQRYLAG